MAKFYHIDMDPALEAGIGDSIMHPVVADTDIHLPDGSVIPKGTMGGYIESEENLAQDGSWIGPDVFVYDGASVTDGAYVENRPAAGSDFCQTELCGGTHVAGENIYHFIDADNESCIVSGADVGDPETGGSEILLFQGTDNDIFIAVDDMQGNAPEIAWYTQDGSENLSVENLSEIDSAAGSYADLGSIIEEMRPAVHDQVDAGWQQLDMNFMKNDIAMGRETRTFCVSESEFHRLPFLEGLMDNDKYDDLMSNAKTSFEYTVGRDGNEKTMYSPMQLTYEPVYSLERTGRDGNTRTYDVAGILTFRTDIDGKNSQFFEDGEYSRRILVTDTGKMIVDLDAGIDNGEASNHILPINFDSRDIPMFKDEFDSLARLRIFGRDDEARGRKEVYIERGMASYREFLTEKLGPAAEIADRVAEQSADNIAELHFSIDTLMGYRDFLYEEAADMVKDNISEVKGELDAASYLITIADEYRVSPNPENILHARPHTEAFQIMSHGRLEGRPAVEEELGRLDRGEISSLNDVPMSNTDFSDQSDAILLDYFHETVDQLYADRAGSGKTGQMLSVYEGTKDGKPCIRWNDIADNDRPGVYREVIELLQDHRDTVHQNVDPVSRIAELQPALDRINEKIDAVTASIEKNYSGVAEVSSSMVTAQMTGRSFAKDADMLRTGSQLEKDMAVRDIARTCIAAEWMPQDFKHVEPDMDGFDKEDFMSRAFDRVNGDGPEKIFFDEKGVAWHGDGTKVLANPVRNERMVIKDRIYNPEMDRVFDGEERPTDSIEKISGDAVENGPVPGEFPETSRHMTGIEGIDEYASYGPVSVRTSDVVSGLDRWLTEGEYDRLRDLGIAGRTPETAADNETSEKPDTGTEQEQNSDEARVENQEPDTEPAATSGSGAPVKEDSYKRSVGPKARINEEGKVEISKEKMDELTRDGKGARVEELREKLEVLKSDIMHYSDKYKEISEMLGNDQRNISMFSPAQIVKANMDAACHLYAQLGGMTGKGSFVEKPPTDMEIRQDFRDFQSSNYHFTAVYLRQTGYPGSVRDFENNMYEKTGMDGEVTGDRAMVYSSTSDGIIHKLGIALMESPLGMLVQGIELLRNPADSVKNPLDKGMDRDSKDSVSGHGTDNSPGGSGVDGTDASDPIDEGTGTESSTDNGTSAEGAAGQNDSVPEEDRVEAGEPDDDPFSNLDELLSDATHEDAGPADRIMTDNDREEDDTRNDTDADETTEDPVYREEDSVSDDAESIMDSAGTGTDTDDMGEMEDDSGSMADGDGEVLRDYRTGRDADTAISSTGLEREKADSQGDSSLSYENRAMEHAVDAAAGTVPVLHAEGMDHGADASSFAAHDQDATGVRDDAGDTSDNELYADRLQDIRDGLDRVFDTGTDGEDMEHLKEDIADGVVSGNLSPEDLMDMIRDTALDNDGNIQEEDAATAGTVGAVAADMLQEGEGQDTSAGDFMGELADSLFGAGESSADDGSMQESFWDAAEDAVMGSYQDLPFEPFESYEADDFSQDIENSCLSGMDTGDSIENIPNLKNDIIADITDRIGEDPPEQDLLDQCVSDSLIEGLTSPGTDAFDTDAAADRAFDYYNMAMDEMHDGVDTGITAEDDPAVQYYQEDPYDYGNQVTETDAADYDAYLQSLEGSDTDSPYDYDTDSYVPDDTAAWNNEGADAGMAAVNTYDDFDNYDDYYDSSEYLSDFSND